MRKPSFKDNVVHNSGGDLIVYYQILWRQCHQLSLKQAEARQRTDEKLQAICRVAQHRAQSLSSLEKALKDLVVLEQDVDTIAQSMSDVYADLTALDAFVDAAAAQQLQTTQEKRVHKAFADAAERDLMNERMRRSEEDRESNINKRRSTEIAAELAQQVDQVASIELSEEKDEELEEFLGPS